MRVDLQYQPLLLITQARARDGLFGRGIVVQSGAALSATSLVVSGNREVGIYTSGAETSLTLTDTVVRDTQERLSDGADGLGVNVQQGAVLSAASLVVSGNRDVGLIAAAATSVTLTDTVIRDTRAQLSDGTLGYGVYVHEGAALSAASLVVSRNRQ